MLSKSSDRKSKRVLRQLRQMIDKVEDGFNVDISDWEIEFLESVCQRIEAYGSAFHDNEKGNRGDPLSALQNQKVKEIAKKFKAASSPKISAEPQHTVESIEKEKKTMAVTPPKPVKGPPQLKVISNPTPPNGEPQAYIPRCARPNQGRPPRLICVNGT